MYVKHADDSCIRITIGILVLVGLAYYTVTLHPNIQTSLVKPQNNIRSRRVHYFVVPITDGSYGVAPIAVYETSDRASTYITILTRHTRKSFVVEPLDERHSTVKYRAASLCTKSYEKLRKIVRKARDGTGVRLYRAYIST
jgi:hypothetical protein